MNRKSAWYAAALIASFSAVGAEQRTTGGPPVQTLQTQPQTQRPGGRGQRPQIPIKEDRARLLYVSNDPDDHSPGTDFQRQTQQKTDIDKRYAEVTKGI